jgi:hypothetical protein
LDEKRKESLADIDYGEEVGIECRTGFGEVHIGSRDGTI